MNYPVFGTNRLMDHFFDDFWTAVPRTLARDAEWSPPCDIEEAKDYYMISLEVPGIPRDQIKVETHDNQVWISGERSSKKETESEEGQFYSERRYGKFQRAFTLPQGVDASKVDANYEDGVLRVYVPKGEVLQTRQIQIGSGKPTGRFAKAIAAESKTHQGSSAA